MAQAEKRRIGRRTIEVTHPDKLLFPDAGITKAELVDHYARVAPVMVPHVRDRPMSQHRFPDGINGQDFWHKQVPRYFPEWIPRVRVRTVKGPQEQVLCNEAATLGVPRQPELHHPARLAVAGRRAGTPGPGGRRPRPWPARADHCLFSGTGMG